MSATIAPVRGQGRALLSAMRPRQWIKNGLITVAPGAAGVLTHDNIINHVIVAFFAFCAVSSAVYLLNDLRDVDADRQHPTKRYRAIASGQLSHTRAITASVVLFIIGFALPFLLAGPGGLLLILGLYVVFTLAYIVWLKEVAVLELVIVGSGFFLRSYGGAVACHIPVSAWFLIVVSFGAFFIVVGKRSSELSEVGAGTTRKVLAEYTPDFLHSALTMSATVAVTGYCLWAFDTSTTGLSSTQHHVVPIRLSIVPVVLAILSVMRTTESAQGQSPEDLILKNRTVQSYLLVWAVLLGIGIYL
ncbi:MAG: decaprenyl-phosphate phosphoribosyltransferase [Acidobacteria bacterium]|nr:decaprenyl-phosphate phosphoribosyltransferase [Acidobacteriota bacterium]